MNELLSPAHATALDAADPLRHLRGQFLFPQHQGADQAYFVGNSLGLQPRGAQAMVQEVMDLWARIAVEGHGVFVVVAHPSAVGTGEKFVDHGGCRVRRQAAEHGGSTEFRTAGSFITLGGKAAMSGPFASRLAS